MEPFSSPDGFAEVTRYARMLLRQAEVGDRLPTPVDDLLACAELVVSGQLTLTEEHEGFFARALGVLQSALKKAIGLIDLRENTIYLNPTVLPQRITFVKLHETGHKVLPWQRQAYLYLDDETTLDPDVRQHFEQEANHFAADLLFQVDRFDREARDLPLALKSPMALGKRYGASAHAAIRRYVAGHPLPCTALVLEPSPEEQSITAPWRLKRVVQSPAFARQHGDVNWPEHLSDCEGALLEPVLRGRRFAEDGIFALRDRDGHLVECGVHLFNSTYNVFMFIHPLQARVRSRTRIVVRS